MCPNSTDDFVPLPERWLTLDQAAAYTKIKSSTLGRIPPALLPRGKAGKSNIFGLHRLDELMARLEGTTLQALIAQVVPPPATAGTPVEKRPRGRPRKTPVESAQPRRPRGRPRKTVDAE